MIDALDDAEYSGSLLILLQEMISFINRNNHKAWKKLPISRLKMPDYPDRAITEACVNALIHRDYLEYGSEVHIDIYDDRLEISSPGGMFDGSLVQNLDPMNITSKRRNPVIADIFSRLRLMERRGSGFKKIMEDYHAYSASKEQMPKFRSDAHDFFIVLPNLNYGLEGVEYIEEKTTQKTTQKNDEITQKLTKVQLAILKYLAEHPSATRIELSNNIDGVSEDGVKYNLARLQEIGLLKRIGGRKQGLWEVSY